MSSYLRLAGTARLADGARLEWTVADGGRGRRWRAVATIDGHITHALLLEVALDRSVSRLELTTPGGLLTLHPDTDGATLHGNAVTTDGVRHLSYAWGPDHAVAVAGRPIADAVTAHRLAATVGVGESRAIRALVVAPDLGLTETSVTYTRVTDGSWRLADAGRERTLAVDPRGIPSAFADGSEWPLELDET